MTDGVLLGIDIGTQSVRTALLDLDGRVLSIASSSMALEIEQPGWAAQDPDDWWAAATTGIRRVLDETGVRPRDVLAIGTDAQMHATIPVDGDGGLLSHRVALWCDKRAAATVDSFAASSTAGRAMRLAANPPLPAWVGFKMRWLAENRPDLYARTRHFLTGASFINLRLTGEIAVDLSEASGYFLMDAERLEWSAELADLLGIDLDRLPPLCRSSDVVGRVSAGAASLTGLMAGTPVVAGAGDMPCMLLAAGLAHEGQAVDISGTASDLCVFADRPVLDPPIQNLHHAADGWIPFGIAESGGGSIQWIKDELAADLRERAAHDGVSPYALLDQLAGEAPPGAGGLLFLPYLLGERLLGSPLSRGALIGLTPRTGIGSIARAAMEGVCFELRRTLEIAEHAGASVTSVSTTGGGARSEVWSQIKADIYERPVVAIEASEGGVVGSAMLAGVGAGVFSSPRAAVDAWVRPGRIFHPNAALQPRYRALYELFTDLHGRMQGPYEALARVP